MNDELKCVCVVCGSIVLVVAILVLGSSGYYYAINKAAMENGYVQRTLPGQGGVYWTKGTELLTEKE